MYRQINEITGIRQTKFQSFFCIEIIDPKKAFSFFIDEKATPHPVVRQ
jgi:hypothetical protein